MAALQPSFPQPAHAHPAGWHGMLPGAAPPRGWPRLLQRRGPRPARLGAAFIARGRPPRRDSALGPDVPLLNCYSQKQADALIRERQLDLRRLAKATGYTFSNKEVQVLALARPNVWLTSGECSPPELAPRHLAVLGEQVLKLAATVLVWDALGLRHHRTTEAAARAAAPAAVPPAAPVVRATLFGGMWGGSRSGSPDRGGGGGMGNGGCSAAAGTSPGTEVLERRRQCHIPRGKELNVAVSAALAGAAEAMATDWEMPLHMPQWWSVGSPSKQDQAHCVRALLATAYLDGGVQGGACRMALGHVRAALEEHPHDSLLQEVGELVKRAAALASTGSSDGAEGAAPAQGAGDEQDHEPSQAAPPRGEPLPRRHLAAVLRGLAALGYRPRDEDLFEELSDVWYQYLCGCDASLLRSPPPAPKGERRQAARVLLVERAAALLALGGALYRAAAAELLLEKLLQQVPDAAERCPDDRMLLNARATQLVGALDGLLSPQVRLAQMEEQLGLRAPVLPGHEHDCPRGASSDAGSSPGGGTDGDEGWAQYGSTTPEAAGPLLAKCVDGVLAAVMLEGGGARGVAAARAVARGLVRGSAAYRQLQLQLGER